MFRDGLIGNLGIIEVLGLLTAGQFNKALPKDKSPYKLEDIIPQAYDYLYPPLTEEDKKAKVQAALVGFMTLQPGANQNLLENQDG